MRTRRQRYRCNKCDGAVILDVALGTWRQDPVAREMSEGKVKLSAHIGVVTGTRITRRCTNMKNKDLPVLLQTGKSSGSVLSKGSSDGLAWQLLGSSGK